MWNIKGTAAKAQKRPPCTRQSRADQGRRFKGLFRSLGLTAADAAKVLHVTPRTIHNWTSGAVPVPPMAVRLLRLHLRYELPGHAWAGWTLAAGKLYTPEGFALEPQEVSWWSLLVRQARGFRALYDENNALRALRQDARGSRAPGAGPQALQPVAPLCESALPAKVGARSCRGFRKVHLRHHPHGNHGENKRCFTL